MTQLRQDYPKFVERDAEILVVGPESPQAFARWWQERRMPFVGLPDPKHEVARLYGQEVNWLKLGRMPALLVIDKAGRIRYRHYADNMSDIPGNAEVLGILDELNARG
jgi:peroxiredoxin